MKVSLKSLLSDANNGFATLPHLNLYREGLEDSEIDIPDECIMTCLYSPKTKRLYLFNSKDETTMRMSIFKTLNRNGYKEYKKLLWETFNKYQTNNVPRYWDKQKSNKIVLTEDQFYNILDQEYYEIERSTLFQRYDYERRLESIEKICEQHGLDYEKFKKEREEARTKI